MAERVVDLVSKKYLSKPGLKECHTEVISFSGSGFNSAQEVGAYVEVIRIKLKQFDLPYYFATYLVYNYGKQTEIVLDLVKNHQDPDQDIALAKAELDFGIHYEMVLTPLDFFVRRTGMVYFNIHRLKKLMDIILLEFVKVSTAVLRRNSGAREVAES
jgi:glycerol-3-phosphate dehydrogenase